MIYNNIWEIVTSQMTKALILLGLAVFLAMISSSFLSGYASVTNANNIGTNSSVLPPPQPQGIANVGVTPNQKAAGGPLPGNHTMALQEAKCAAAEKNPPWYPTVNPAELHDSSRRVIYRSQPGICLCVPCTVPTVQSSR